MKKTINVKGKEIKIFSQKEDEYISLTDIARYKNPKRTDYLISNWIRNRETIEYLGLWEKLNNPQFNPIEFNGFRIKSGLNSFILSSKQWIKKTGAIGIISKSGRYGGTFAHKDIAFEFATWISIKFKLYLIKEYQRLKIEENEKLKLGWNVKRELVKINYAIHTNAIKENLIPPEISSKEAKIVYASEADILNKALFGKTAKEWSKQNQIHKGNIRDYANITQLVILANLESLNSEFIKQKISQSNRLIKLNQIAIYQTKILINTYQIKKLENKG
ncbi:KilA-N domain-containing protein [Candidatus Woesearchaeota archaeon]|jgi:hypothetical protein|nr:KilA-N domain-containing protein [Candidatus Woesearchaeota archaeon]